MREYEEYSMTGQENRHSKKALRVLRFVILPFRETVRLKKEVPRNSRHLVKANRFLE